MFLLMLCHFFFFWDLGIWISCLSKSMYMYIDFLQGKSFINQLVGASVTSQTFSDLLLPLVPACETVSLMCWLPGFNNFPTLALILSVPRQRRQKSSSRQPTDKLEHWIQDLLLFSYWGRSPSMGGFLLVVLTYCTKVGAWLDGKMSWTFPTLFTWIPPWFYNNPGIMSFQLVFRALTEVFWSIYCYKVYVSLEGRVLVQHFADLTQK